MIRSKTDEYREIRANNFSDCLISFLDDSHAVFERSAILVCSAVPDRCHELVKHISVVRMDLDRVTACHQDMLSRNAVAVDDLVNFFCGERMRQY